MKLKFNADHHFVIGDDHVMQGKPCQDHALSLEKENIAIAVVSDGCSSGNETDMGARVLTFGTLRALLVHYDVTSSLPSMSTIEAERSIIEKNIRSSLGLTQGDMLATCVCIAITPSGGFAHLMGDGVIAVRMRDGRLLLSRFEWDGNMPAYPAYRQDEFASFIAAHGGDNTAKRFSEERVIRYPSGTETNVDLIPMTMSEGISGVTRVFSALAVQEEIETIAVFTDGIFQIDGVDWKDAAEELLCFKNMSGAFAKRRMNAAMKKYRNKGAGPRDDCAYAVIHIERSEAEGEDHEHGNQ